MITKRMLVMGSDKSYYEYTIIAIKSFLDHNPGWSTLVMDVGMTPEQVRSLRKLALVVEFPREELRGTGRYIPSAKARCLALARFPDAETLMLYLDGDTVTLGSIESMVEEFLASGTSIGIGREDDPRFFAAPISNSWAGGVVPAEFSNRHRWQDRPVLNTGVLLATGDVAAEVGRRSSEWYEQLKDRFIHGEQTIINSIIYDNEIPYFSLSALQHCFLREDYLTKTGRPYIDPVYLDKNRIVIRHFCHANKQVLDHWKPDLLAYYRLPEVETIPSEDEPPQTRPTPKPRLHRSNPLGLPKPSDYYQSSRGEVVEWVASLGITAERVLEIGCSSGSVGRTLKRSLGANYYVGIDNDAAAVLEARTHLDDVLAIDLDTMVAKDIGIPEGEFDLLVALDVLEHLRNPWDLLADCTRFLRPNGGVLLSIPNVQNLALIEGLSRGEWRYQSCGLLDATHLRFFTWEGIQQLLGGAGFEIAESRCLLRPTLKLDSLPEQGITIRLGKMTLEGLSKEEVIRIHVWQYLVYARLR